jgi:ferredoxin
MGGHQSIKRRILIMTVTGSNLSRRKFMMVGSAAIASPLLLNVANSMAAGNTAGTRTAETGISKGTKVYYIGKGCIGCQVCKTRCPAQAIKFGDCKNEIDQKKCIHCGTCYKGCHINVISETILS